MTMRALLTQINGHSEIKNVEIPKIEEGDVLIKTLGVGICGTDILKINHKLLKKPTVLGHEIVGEIYLSKNSALAVGDKIVTAHHVACLQCHYCRHKNYSMCRHFKKTNIYPGGFAQFVHISKEHIENSLFKIPNHHDWKHYVWTEPLACCVRNVRRLPILAQDHVAIIGYGSIGILLAHFLKILHINVTVFDIDDERLKFANSNHLASVNPFKNKDLIDNMIQNKPFDGVIFTSGPGSQIPLFMNCVRDGGFINLFAHLSGENPSLDIAEFYHREIQLITSYSPSPESLKEAFELIKAERITLGDLFVTYRDDEFDQALKDIQERRIYKGLVVFPE